MCSDNSIVVWNRVDLFWRSPHSTASLFYGLDIYLRLSTPPAINTKIPWLRKYILFHNGAVALRTLTINLAPHYLASFLFNSPQPPSDSKPGTKHSRSCPILLLCFFFYGQPSLGSWEELTTSVLSFQIYVQLMECFPQLIVGLCVPIEMVFKKIIELFVPF